MEGSVDYGKKLRFRFKNPNADQIVLSNDDKSVRTKGNYSRFIGVQGDQPFSKDERSHFEVIIDDGGNSFLIMVGLALGKEVSEGGFYTKKSGYLYYMATGYVYNSGKTLQQLYSQPCKKGDRLKVVFDPKEAQLSFFLND